MKSAPMFRNAYRSRRCLVPVSGYFEWLAIRGSKHKQPYAISTTDGRPFALAGIWEGRRVDGAHEQITFAIITCPANELMQQIHDRMPVILHERDYARWLSDEPDPSDLLVPFPSELLAMWPVDVRVGSPRNEWPGIVDPVALDASEDDEPRLL